MSNLTMISSRSPLRRIIHAVHAVEAGEYTSDLLSDLASDSGELGQLARILDTMAHKTQFRDYQLSLLRKIIPIGLALSAEKDFNRLLETLVIEAQDVTHADAGTLYLLENDELKFVILKNTTLSISLGGASRDEIPFKPVRLHNNDGSENRANVVSHVALTQERINIADAYNSDGFDFSGTKSFDSNTNYHSKSFLTIPLKNNSGDVIGVLQLINAKEVKSGDIVSFEDDDVLEALVLLASAALDGYIREASLRLEIANLKIEINQNHRARQVDEITSSKYFKDLKAQVSMLRTTKNPE